MSLRHPPIGASPLAHMSDNLHRDGLAAASIDANRPKVKGKVLQVFEHSIVEELRAATAAASNPSTTVSSTAESPTSSASTSRSTSPVSSSTTPASSPETSPGRAAANALRTAKSCGELRPDATAITVTGPRRNCKAVEAAYSLLSPYLLTPQVFLECEALLHATRVREILASISMTLGRNLISSSHLFPNLSAKSFSDWLIQVPQVTTATRYTGLGCSRLKVVCGIMNSNLHAEISGDIHGATVEAAIRAVVYWSKHNKRHHQELREFLLWLLDVVRFEDVPKAAMNTELKTYVTTVNRKRPSSSEYHTMIRGLNKTLRDKQIQQSPHIVHKADFDKLSKDFGKLTKHCSEIEAALQRERTARANEARAHKKQIGVLNATLKQHDARVTDLQTTIHHQAAQLQNIKTDHDKEIQKIKTDHDKEIQSLNTKLQIMKTDHDKEIQNNKTDHDKEIQNIKTDHDKDIQNIKSAHDKEIRSLNTKLQIMKTDHDKEIQKIKTDHDKEIQNMKSDHDREIQSLHTKFDKLQKEVRERDLIIAARDQALANREAQLDALFKRLDITI
ncbi:hypothetical protein FN846DRAFT_983563 [Sphaerosporella brunnea]|uniref:Uncharacterized protein n=1 Tax=Sphaerosporella brunnea TaxID=1250544 RepID=A0A5J5FA89_9PEZI|nr:hypothetical protein FN846DRAFT_983563 [Sphaerosporella brunnea]